MQSSCRMVAQTGHRNLLTILAVLLSHQGLAAETTTVRIAACQAQPRVINFRLEPEEVLAAVDQNLAVLESIVHRAGQQKCDALAFPEDTLGLLPWVGMNESTAAGVLSQAVPRMLDRLGRAAASHRMYLVVCSDFVEADGAMYNTAFLLGRDGKELGRYHKVCPTWSESGARQRGTSFPVFPTPDLGTVGLAICYDLVMPETSRCLALAGADVIFFPTMGTAAIGGDSDLGVQALRVRAVENFVWLVVAHRGQGAMIISPQGKIIAQAEGLDGLAVADIDPHGSREGGDSGNWQPDMRARLFRERNPAAFGLLTDPNPPALAKLPFSATRESAGRVFARVLTVGEEEFNAAVALARQGKTDAAIAAFERLRTEYRDSWIDRVSTERLQQLRAAAPTTKSRANPAEPTTTPEGSGPTTKYPHDQDAASALGVQWKPNRVLVVVGDQWADPNSEIIDGVGDDGPPTSYVKQASVGGRAGEPFWHLVAFLKTYNIPFDILRLDQANLYLNYFLDHRLRPAYGTILWDVDSDSVPPRHYEVLSQVVNEYGISVIALYDSIKEPALQKLLGLSWPRKYYHSDSAPYRVTGEHFITRGLQREYQPPRGLDTSYKPLVTVADAAVLATQGDGPALTVREIPGGASAIWIGGSANDALHDYPCLLPVVRRAIVHAVGYSVYKTFPKTVVFSMDDPSCTAMFERWHFPALTQQEIVDWIVTPLCARKAVLQVNMTPGRVVESTRIVEPNWTQVYTDELGEHQDMVSNGKGWQRGIELGVIEVQSHGWTHMNPHLEPYWAGDLSSRLHPHWGSEFFDRIRGVEIPGTVQLFAMQRSVDALVQQWDRRPLYLVAGQNAESHSYANHTARLAKKAGFAMMRDFWLGPDYIINLDPHLFPSWDQPDVIGLEGERPMRIGCHDFDVYKDHDYIKKKLAEFGPDYRFAGLNEIIGYLHAEVAGGAIGTITFRYDPVFCQHFKQRDSTWQLHLSDTLRTQLARNENVEVVVDGQANRVRAADYFQELTDITVPAGVGPHSWELRR